MTSHHILGLTFNRLCPYLILFITRDFISSIALKEMPDDPETLKKNARNKRKKAQEAEEDGASIKKMTSGVSK